MFQRSFCYYDFVTLATSAFDCQMSMENMRLQMLLCLPDKKERGGLKSLKRNAQQILFLQLAVKPSTHTASVAVVLLIITEGLARVQKKAWRSTVPPLPCAFSLFII